MLDKERQNIKLDEEDFVNNVPLDARSCQRPRDIAVMPSRMTDGSVEKAELY